MTSAPASRAVSYTHLWHGAGLTFLVWGGLHGLYNVVSRLTKPLRLAVNRLTRLNRCKKLHHFLQRAMTFCMVAFAWIFFRADSLDQALLFISRLPLRLGQTLLSWTAINRALAGIGFYANNGVAPVSYTHLDVYKRQAMR